MAKRGAARWWDGVRPADRHELRAEAIAGVPVAVGGVPDGMAASVLTGVNPIHGLYASFAGPLVGGLTSSTRLHGRDDDERGRARGGFRAVGS